MPSGQVPSVRIPADTFAAEIRAGDASRVLSQTAGLISDIANKISVLEDNRAIASTKIEYRDLLGDFSVALAKDRNYDTHVKQFEDFHASATSRLKGSVRSKRAGEAISLWLDQQAVDNKNTVQMNAWNASLREEITLMPLRVEEFQRQHTQAKTLKQRKGIKSDIAKYFIGLEQSGVIGQDQAAILTKDAWDGADTASAKVDLALATDNVLGVALAQKNTEGSDKGLINVPEANKVIDESNLPNKEKVELKNTINTQSAHERQVRDNREADLQEQTNADLYLEIVNGEKPAAQIIADINAAIEVGEDGVQPLTVAQAEKLKGIMSDPVSETSIETQIKVERLISQLDGTQGRRKQILEVYATLAKSIAATDGKGYIKRIFATTKTKQDASKGVLLDSVTAHAKLIRDSIEIRDLLGLDASGDIRRFVADRAVIAFKKKFPDTGEFTETEIETGATDIMKEFALGNAVFERLAEERELQAADTVERAVKAVRDSAARLRQAGNIEEAKAVLQEAIDAGLISRNDLEGKKKKEPSNNTVQKLLDAIRRRRE